MQARMAHGGFLAGVLLVVHIALGLLCSATLAAQQGGASRESLRESSFDEAIPQVIVGGEWQSIIHLHSGRSNPATVTIRFYGQDGAALKVPFRGRTPVADTYQVTVAPGGTTVLETEQPQDTSLGWGVLDVPSGSSDGYITGYVVLRNRVPNVRPDYEAVFPFQYQLSSKSMLLYDNTAGFGTVLFITNGRDFGSTRATITLAVKDENGARVALDQFSMVPRASQFFSLAAKYPSTAGTRGAVEISATDGYAIVAGLRINPTNAFTALQAWEQ